VNGNVPYRLIISGGGTGGHVFPALAIAQAFRQRHPDAHILFVGAKGRMEMTRVPEAGYKIVGLWISGLQRKLTLTNLLFPLKLIVSYWQAMRIVKKFKPHAVVGTGGYASGPVMLAATRTGVPALIQEQNSYAGLTNKQLASKVQRVCVAYPGMEKYFPKEIIRFTGNPVRKDILDIASKHEHALKQFAFDTGLKTLLILGGSLGARTINESLLAGFDKLLDAKVQVIWQTGKAYYEHVKAQVQNRDLRKIRIHDFLQQMDLAYAACDVVISRAGALAISEICIARRPAILVPSPNVAEDHQTKNALALASKQAAVVVRDDEARDVLVDEALKLLFDDHRCRELAANIAPFGKPNATEEIVDELEDIIRKAS
jgi:UDP-N-acetylglucosamine--N-acetylmuramyl-(pentapeptide) pyrophosphoryl-undecaprenol N-acetylglucosamine transferase